MNLSSIMLCSMHFSFDITSMCPEKLGSGFGKNQSWFPSKLIATMTCISWIQINRSMTHHQSQIASMSFLALGLGWKHMHIIISWLSFPVYSKKGLTCSMPCGFLILTTFIISFAGLASFVHWELYQDCVFKVAINSKMGSWITLMTAHIYLRILLEWMSQILC